MVSLYDAPSALLCCEAGVDLLLVGDSLGNVILGYEHTLPVTIEVMEHHTAAVARGARSSSRPDVPVVADMPFGSYHGSGDATLANALRLMRAGAQAVKLEGAGPRAMEAIALLSEAGIPVMGHLGYTPQSALTLAKVVHDKSSAAASKLMEESEAVERAGCFAVVLEVVRIEAASEITGRLSIPTIGIGSGPHCDGQVLIFHDLLGLSATAPYKFVRRFADVHAEMARGVGEYVREVRGGGFPTAAHGWAMDPGDAKDRREESTS